MKNEDRIAKRYSRHTLQSKNVLAGMEFYKKAFNAVELRQVEQS